MCKSNGFTVSKGNRSTQDLKVQFTQITHYHVVPKLCDLLSSVEDKLTYFKEHVHITKIQIVNIGLSSSKIMENSTLNVL